MTTKKQLTEYIEQPVWSNYHRLLGERLYMTDMDAILYTFKNDDYQNPIPVACIDYKHYSIKSISTKSSAVRCQQACANLMKIPFFIVLFRIEMDASVYPSFFVLPANLYASSMIEASGAWMSAKEFSQFEHQLRKLSFIRFDPIADNADSFYGTSAAVGIKTLGDLPEKLSKFPIPFINIELK